MVLIQHVLNSLSSGSEYVLVALGLTLIFGVLGTPNIAHGGAYMMSAFAGYWAVAVLGLPFLVALIVGGVVGAILGIAIQFVTFEKLRHGSELTLMVAALAMLTIITEIAVLLFGTDSYRIPSPINTTWSVGGLRMSAMVVISVGATLLIAGLITLLIRRTKFGRGMQAIAENRAAALMMGVSENRITYGTFAVGSAVGGLAGVMLGVMLPINADMGHDTILKAFVVIVVGGIGSVVGAVVVGYAIGILETFAAVYVGGEYVDMVAFVILVVFLVARPEGLVRRSGTASSRAVQG